MDEYRPRRRNSEKINVNGRQALLGAVAIVALIFLITGVTSSYDYVETGEVAVIKNNVTGHETYKSESGIILHLPWGLTDVFKLDRTVQVFRMTQSRASGDRAGIDNVKIKVADGSNIEVDVEVNYKIIPSEAPAIIKRVGSGDAFKNKMIRSYSRAVIREKYGLLTLEEISDPSKRTSQNVLVSDSLNQALRGFGIEVSLVNTTNFVFNSDYQNLVKSKKATAQEYLNQAAAQDQAQKEQETRIAEGEREKNNELIEARGKAQKRTIEAENRAKQLIFRAEGEAYAKNKEGDRALEIAQADAQAIEREGLNTATGIKRLAEAYSEGGTGLVKEALSRKLVGAKINGRPYSLSERIDRIEIDQKRRAAATGN
ncbi:MAG: hypothetical protein KDB53_11505 [Planctomycetes bacterium]|nr:hypothetical protein [Planctomycetota bacterium]